MIPLYHPAQLLPLPALPGSQRRLYDAITHEYLTLNSNDNPPKTGIQLTFDSSFKSPTSFMNVMAARVSSGHFGSKTIMCDMRTGRTESMTMIFDPENRLVAVLESAELTAIRCAHMAVMSVDLFSHGRFPMKNFTYGFIGGGTINQKTAWLLHDVFGVNNFVMRGHPLRPCKNIEKFPAGTRMGDYQSISNCEVVFVATTETTEEAQLNIEDLDGPLLFITQDTGCLLDESFRKHYPSFTDNCAQIDAHWEECFPWDKGRQPPLYALDHLTLHEKACVYLYGMAFTDVLVALHVLGLLK